MTVRVRFAPSPTGHVHIGNIRVAIFNWLFARHQGGSFLLRIEDTDLTRSTPAAVETLLSAMEWLGLDHDEQPLYQTRTRPRHDAVVARMLADGFASRQGENTAVVLHLDARLFHPSFVSQPRDQVEVDLATRGARLAATAHGLEVTTTASSGEAFTDHLGWDALAELRILGQDGAIHDGAGLRARVTAALAAAKTKTVPETGTAAGTAALPVGELLGAMPAALCFRRRYVFFDDLILGRREKPLDSMRDLVVARSDGSPVFHLANVVDDVDMRVSHILRGNDHVENTFRHLFIFRAMGATPPCYGHLPMIVNAKGKPYSKRDGDAYVGDFQSKGILPQCMFNFLALCGWSPGDEREILSRQEMIAAFALERVKDTPAQFDLEKLRWMNGQYLLQMPSAELLPLVRGELAAAGIDAAALAPEWLERLVDLMKPRVRTLAELLPAGRYFFDEAVTLDGKAVRKLLLKDGGAGLAVLARLGERLAAQDDWSEGSLQQTITAFSEQSGLPMGQVAQPLRVAVTGSTASPGIWETLHLVGRRRTLARIERVLAEVKAE